MTLFDKGSEDTVDENVLGETPMVPELISAPSLRPEPDIPENETNILSTEPLRPELAPPASTIESLPEDETNVPSTEPLEPGLRTPSR